MQCGNPMFIARLFVPMKIYSLQIVTRCKWVQCNLIFVLYIYTAIGICWFHMSLDWVWSHRYDYNWFIQIDLSKSCNLSENMSIWLLIMLKSSCGDGMRPVSSFDQTGISLKLISNAPDETSCKAKCNNDFPLTILINENIQMCYEFHLPEPLTYFQRRKPSCRHKFYFLYTIDTI